MLQTQVFAWANPATVTSLSLLAFCSAKQLNVLLHLDRPFSATDHEDRPEIAFS